MNKNINNHFSFTVGFFFSDDLHREKLVNTLTMKQVNVYVTVEITLNTNAFEIKASLTNDLYKHFDIIMFRGLEELGLCLVECTLHTHQSATVISPRTGIT